MPNNAEVIRAIQGFCNSTVLEQKTSGKRSWDDYKKSWLDHTEQSTGKRLQGEQLTGFTTKQIQTTIAKLFGTNAIQTERRVDVESALAFDLWNSEERTAFEICLGAIPNEFGKDVLKGLLDPETIELVILYRKYKYGKAETIFDEKWFAHPGQQVIIKRAGLLKLKVSAAPLLP